MNYKIVSKVCEDKYESLLKMIHESFEEYEKKGLHFTCCDYDCLDLKSKVLNGMYFVAVDDNQNPLGITSVSIKCSENEKWAYENITAISPSYKGKGIGTALYKARTEYLKEINCSYILSDTATDAINSVLWHMKKCNCKKYGFQSFPNTNYYSYVFREDLKDRLVWSPLFYRIRFFMAYIRTKMLKRKDGSIRWLNLR